jgi:lipid A 3-O-deacylase
LHHLIASFNCVIYYFHFWISEIRLYRLVGLSVLAYTSCLRIRSTFIHSGFGKQCAMSGPCKVFHGSPKLIQNQLRHKNMIFLKNIIVKTVTVTSVLACLSSSCYAVDSLSAEFATGNRTQMARIGTQWAWKSRWWESNGTHIGGYWDLTLAEWHGTRFRHQPGATPGATQNITDVGITPVFRLQRNSGTGPYIEAGVGAHLLSDQYNNNGRRLSGNFQFGDHVGVGYIFANRVDIGVKIQHFSNAGIRKPNDGVNFAVARVSYAF